MPIRLGFPDALLHVPPAPEATCSEPARAQRIHYNWFEGAAYHELDLIGGCGDAASARWTGLVREDGTWSATSSCTQSGLRRGDRVGGDGSGESRGRVRFANNTIAVTSGQDATAFRIFDIRRWRRTTTC